MKHSEIQGLLADWAAGGSDPTPTATLEDHLTRCLDCREWVETYRLLGNALAARTAAEHPSSAELGAWAALDGPPPDAARAHLATCPACREELEIVRAAVLAARDDAHHDLSVARAPRVKRSVLRWAAAAGIAFLGIAGSIWFLSREESPPQYVMSGGAFTGDEVISAPSIHASQMVVQSGSRVVFEASEMVSLGDGFVVAADATFEAGTTGRAIERHQ